MRFVMTFVLWTCNPRPVLPNKTATIKQELVISLIKHAAELISDNKLSEAEAIYYQCLSLTPNDTSLLRRVGDLYRKTNREEDAKLCYRGVIPESANDRYFDAQILGSKVVGVEQADGTTRLDAYPPENKSLKQPITYGEDGEFLPFKRKQTESLGSFTSVSQNGEIWYDGFNAIVMTEERQIIREHIRGNELLTRRVANMAHPFALSGTACFIDARSSDIYYHWMMDVLPKLHVLKKSGISLNSIDHFIVRVRHRFQWESLKMLGIPESKIVNRKTYTHLKADFLIVPFLKNDLGDKVYIGLGFGFASWIPDFLKNAFLPKHPELANVDTNPQSRIFISRRNATSRRILNEDDVLELLTAHGYRTVFFEDLSIPEQACIMANADEVIAVHGAGLTNLSFCKPGTKVLELFSEYVVPCYWSLSNIANLHYHQFMTCNHSGNSINVMAKSGEERRAGDLQVDLESFSKALTAFEQSGNSN